MRLMTQVLQLFLENVDDFEDMLVYINYLWEVLEAL